MYTITKEFTFEAAHRLDLSYESKCNNLHGHSYRVQLVLQAQVLNDNDMVVDYNDLDTFKEFINVTLDHRNINILLTPRQSTAEMLAKYLFDIAKEHYPQVVACRVSETQKTWAEYHV